MKWICASNWTVTKNHCMMHGQQNVKYVKHKSFDGCTKHTGLEVNADKNKYIVTSRDQNAVRSYIRKTDNTSFERLELLLCLGTALTNRNSIQKEIQSRLKSGDVCCHSVQELLSHSLLSKYLKIKIYRTIILPVVFMGVKRGRSFWGRNVGRGCLRIGCWVEYSGLRGTRWQGSGENYTMRSILSVFFTKYVFGWSSREEWDGPAM